MFSQPKALNTSLHWSGRRSSKGFLLSFFLGFFLQYVLIVSFSISLCRSTITMMCEGKMRFHLSRRKKPDGLRISRGEGGRKGWRPLTDPMGGGPPGPNSFIFMQFSAKIWKIIEILDPPLEASTIFWPNFGKRPQTFWALNPLMVKKPSINWTGTHRGGSRISKGGRQPRVKRLLADFYKQECIPVGCVPSSAVAVCWGVSVRGGLCLPRGVCIPACTEADTPPLWTEFLTRASEDITLPQLRCGR